jgi:DNA-binding NarL/FixJ family response regulator
MNDIKVLIIEDEPLIAEDIAACLRRCDYRVTGIVYSAEDALPELARNPPDIAMIDINLNGGQEGISIANAINERFYIPFVYLTSCSDRKTLELAKHTGPSGYIVKPFTEAGLCATLEVALHNFTQKNKHQFPDLVLHKINQLLPSPLSMREFDVIQLIYEGFSNHQIAEKLFVSTNTVKVHIKNAYLKLDAISRATVIVRLRELMLK